LVYPSLFYTFVNKQHNKMEQDRKDKVYPSLIEDPKMEPYLIAYDKKSYIILERGVKEKKDGTKMEILREKCYPTSFRRALEFVIREKVHSHSYKSLDEMLVSYKEIEEDLINSIKI